MHDHLIYQLFVAELYRGQKIMPNSDTALIAHLMRRAGFGANHLELQKLSEKS